MREYWTKALERLASLRFIVDRVVWDPDSRELAIIYTSETDAIQQRRKGRLRGWVATEEPAHLMAPSSSALKLTAHGGGRVRCEAPHLKAVLGGTAVPL